MLLLLSAHVSPWFVLRRRFVLVLAEATLTEEIRKLQSELEVCCRLPLLLLVSRETGRVCDSTLHRSKSRTCHFCGMHARNIVLCCISNQKLFAWVVLCVGICQRSKHEQDKDRRDFQEDRSKLSKVGPCCVFVCYPTDCSNLWNIN